MRNLRFEIRILLRPVLIVTDDEYQNLKIHPDCRILEDSVVVNQTQLLSALSYSGTNYQSSGPQMDINLFVNSSRTILNNSK